MKIFTNAHDVKPIDDYLKGIITNEEYEYYVISPEIPQERELKINYIPYDGFTLKLPEDIEVTSQDLFFIEPSYRDAIILMLLSGFGMFSKVYNIYKSNNGKYIIDTLPYFRLVHINDVWYPIISVIMKSLRSLIKVQLERNKEDVVNYNKYISDIMNEIELLSNIVASEGTDYAKKVIKDIFDKD